ncbi:MAG: hypothetical protein KAT62_03715 [Desulfuromonadales bacterium]|nr:hypothetical protein [Desulfuromonadales bacterium]
MRKVNKFKGYTGKQLLAMVSDESDMVEIDGEMVSLMPRVMTFSNVAEIAEVDEATHISVATRLGGDFMVRTNEV